MKIRKLHRVVAIVSSPFLLFLSVTGIILLFRKTGLYPKSTKSTLVSLHTWEVIMPYIGMVLGLALIFITITGMIIFFKKKA